VWSAAARTVVVLDSAAVQIAFALAAAVQIGVALAVAVELALGAAAELVWAIQHIAAVSARQPAKNAVGESDAGLGTYTGQVEVVAVAGFAPQARRESILRYSVVVA